MTFGRAIITALLAGGLAHTDDGNVALFLVAIFAFAWTFTDDPLPGAIRKALDDYAKDYRR